MQDPYFLVKGEVEASLKKALGCKDRIEGSNESFDGRQKSLNIMESSLKSSKSTLGELSQAINVMVKDPSRFNLTADDVNDRMSQIEELRKSQMELNKWHSERKKAFAAESQELQAKQQQQQQNMAMNNSINNSDAMRGIDPKQRAAADDYFNDSALSQQQMIDRQDEDLDDIGNVIVNIGHMGKQIGEELDAQGKLLDDLDEETDATSNRLQNLNKKLNLALKKSGNCQMGLIVGLVITFIVLVTFVFM